MTIGNRQRQLSTGTTTQAYTRKEEINICRPDICFGVDGMIRGDRAEEGRMTQPDFASVVTHPLIGPAELSRAYSSVLAELGAIGAPDNCLCHSPIMASNNSRLMNCGV